MLSVRVVLRRVFLHYYYYDSRDRGRLGSDVSGSASDGSDDGVGFLAGILDAGD